MTVDGHRFHRSRTAAAKLRKFNPAEFGRSPVDGDNDGFVYDGTVRQRPYVPSLSLAGSKLIGNLPDGRWKKVKRKGEDVWAVHTNPDARSGDHIVVTNSKGVKKEVVLGEKSRAKDTWFVDDAATNGLLARRFNEGTADDPIAGTWRKSSRGEWEVKVNDAGAKPGSVVRVVNARGEAKVVTLGERGEVGWTVSKRKSPPSTKERQAEPPRIVGETRMIPLENNALDIMAQLTAAGIPFKERQETTQEEFDEYDMGWFPHVAVVSRENAARWDAAAKAVNAAAAERGDISFSDRVAIRMPYLADDHDPKHLAEWKAKWERMGFSRSVIPPWPGKAGSKVSQPDRAPVHHEGGSWRKVDGEWAVSAPWSTAPEPGDTVDVTTRNGKRSTVTVGEPAGQGLWFVGQKLEGAPAPTEMDVDEFIAAHPREDGENFFDWQGRIVADLSPQMQSDVLFRTRETYPAAPYIAAGMQRWNAEHGLPPVPDDLIDRPVDIAEADAAARFFESAPDMADDPEVKAAYEDFKAQSQEMWEFLTRPESEGGMGIKVDFTTEVDPYPTALAQAEDLERNHHMTIQSGLGGAHEATMTQAEYDRFRAVHDVFGHAGIGSGFDRHGEYEAWLAHAAMYRGQGRRAMSTEYHGVNSAMWSGAPGSPGTGKSVLLPGEMGEPPWLRAANLRTYTDAYLLQLWYAQDQTPQLRAELMSRGILPRSAAVALLPNPVADEYVAKLGLDETFASRFDLLWFHDA